MNPNPLRIIFAGTPEFAAAALAALLNTDHEIVAVYTQPDRPAGRGLALSESPVKKLAKENNLDIFQPNTLRDAEVQAKLAALQSDLMIVAAYGLILPAAVLKMPRLGCINIHASLLPRWRGASPIQQAIVAGDEKTGISIMQMDEGLDTGPVLLRAECPILPEDTSESLHDRLAALGAKTLLQALDGLTRGQLQPTPQDAATATLARKIHKEAGRLNWQASTLSLDRLIRAFYPWPIAFTHFQGKTLRIFEAKPLPGNSTADPGTLIHVSREGLDVATQDGILRLLRVQEPGSRVLSIADFLNARRDTFIVGSRFE